MSKLNKTRKRKRIERNKNPIDLSNYPPEEYYLKMKDKILKELEDSLEIKDDNEKD